MLHTRITTRGYVLSELFPLDGSDAILCQLHNLKTFLEYNHDTSQLCRRGHDDVSCTRMTTLAFILSELFRLGFRCSFVSAP